MIWWFKPSLINCWFWAATVCVWVKLGLWQWSFDTWVWPSSTLDGNGAQQNGVYAGPSSVNVFFNYCWALYCGQHGRHSFCAAWCLVQLSESDKCFGFSWVSATRCGRAIRACSNRDSCLCHWGRRDPPPHALGGEARSSTSWWERKKGPLLTFWRERRVLHLDVSNPFAWE